MIIRGPYAAVVLLLLFVSLAANLMIAGFVAARVNGPRPQSDIDRLVALGVRSFPPEIQRAVAEQTRQKRADLRARLMDVEAARRTMYDAMRAQPFDQTALEAAFADVRTKTDALQEASQSLVAGAIAQASPETRRRIKPPRGSEPTPVGLK